MKRFTIVLMVILCSIVLYSCNTVERDYQKLAGAKIEFPQSLIKVSGRDTMQYTPKVGNPIMLIYFDSATCGSCAISKLDMWDEVIDSTKLLSPSLEFIFLMSPSRAEYKKVLRDMMLNGTNYNIVLDRGGAFPAANQHLPEDRRFHSMLLNESHCVEVIGDPAYNPAIWELVKSKL